MCSLLQMIHGSTGDHCIQAVPASLLLHAVHSSYSQEEDSTYFLNLLLLLFVAYDVHLDCISLEFRGTTPYPDVDILDTLTRSVNSSLPLSKSRMDLAAASSYPYVVFAGGWECVLLIFE